MFSLKLSKQLEIASAPGEDAKMLMQKKREKKKQRRALYLRMLLKRRQGAATIQFEQEIEDFR